VSLFDAIIYPVIKEGNMEKKSQRKNGFKGGIQKGTTAFDVYSKELDGSLKKAVDVIKLKFSDLELVKQMKKDMKLKLVGDDCFGFAPDGGAWFKKGKLVAVFEAKKQGEDGNAYERWWDNATTAKYLNKKVLYITFCTGAGAAKDKCLDKLRRKAGIMLGKNFKFYNKVEPFTQEEIEKIMIDSLKAFA
jgi:hypothetical protein